MEKESITDVRGGTEDRLVIYPRRWKLALPATGALAFVLATFTAFFFPFGVAS